MIPEKIYLQKRIKHLPKACPKALTLGNTFSDNEVVRGDN
jgi:hypothetical protein